MSEDFIQHKVEELLRSRIGLNPDSVGSRSIMRAVKEGMRSGKMQATSEYLSQLQNNPRLFSALVESIVVPETSFFRNRASFVFLRQWVAQNWRKRTGAKRTLRVLSVPCSTGEEPYSIAITLIEEGLSSDEFHIDAVDISEQAIAKAKEGIYSPYAFRRQTYCANNKYFTLASPRKAGKYTIQHYHIAEEIKKQVVFKQGNLLSGNLLSQQRPYDIIFCRNLLIYFDKPARDRAMAALNEALMPDGLLFLGYAETGLVDKQKYKSVPYPQTFAYSRQDESESPKKSPKGIQTQSPEKEGISSQIRLYSLSSDKKESGPTQPTKEREKNKHEANLELHTIQQMADSGAIEQATEQCDVYLSCYPTDAKGHLLRGELHLVVDDLSAAENCFKKAIYLDSTLLEALTHLMAIKESKGDASEANIIRERMQRIEKTTLQE